MYGQEHPYQKLMKIKHDTPYHKYTIGEHIEKTYDIMKILSNDKVILKAAQDFAEMYCNIIEKDTRKLMDNLTQNNEIKEEYLKKSQEIIIKNIKNKILEENK